MDLTPPEFLPLGGYTARQGRRPTSTGDPIYARVVLFKMADIELAMVSVELLTVPESLVREVRARIPKGVRLFLAATHTHSAPDSQMLNDRMTISVPGIAKFEPKWLEWYASRISKAIADAGTRTPVWSRAVEVEIHHLDLNRGRRSTVFPDQTATWVRDWTTRTPIFFSYAAHAVFNGEERNTVSGDWPGAVAERLRTPVIVGPIGDVSPQALGTSPAARIQAFVDAISAKFGKASTSDGGFGFTTPTAQFRFWTEPIVLDSVRPHPDFAANNRIPQAMAESLVKIFAPPRGEVTAFRIGKLCVVGVPGEPTAALGRRMRDAGRNLGFDSVVVASHVNGWIGYVLEESDYTRGGYEASLSFHGPRTADRLFEAAIRAMRRLSTPAADSSVGLSSAKLRRV